MPTEAGPVRAAHSPCTGAVGADVSLSAGTVEAGSEWIDIDYAVTSTASRAVRLADPTENLALVRVSVQLKINFFETDGFELCEKSRSSAAM